MNRRVKIVTTLGPAVSTREKLRQLLEAGADVVRVNAAHGSEEDRLNIIENVRKVSAELGKFVPILFDLRGLKIRSGPLPDGKKFVRIHEGDEISLVPSPVESSSKVLGINYPKLLEVISPGSRVLISDGLIELHVTEVHDDHAKAQVIRDGQILSKQGVTLPGAPIKGGALTETDRDDIGFAVRNKVDYLGLSFLNDAEDLRMARNVAREHGDEIPALIAKIERPEALANLEEIAEEADGVMVARGDLGVQLPPERVPRAQKDIIAICNRFGTPVITATQMLESMITQPVATRAETNDVANAVWDGTDAVMLSAETAVGKYPIEAVKIMDRIVREAESQGPIRSTASQIPHYNPDREDSVFADAIARAAFAMSDQSPVQHLVVLTMTGGSARRIAKYRPKPSIVAVCDNERVARKMGLVWGVESIVLEVEDDPDEAFRGAGETIIEEGLGEKGEFALIVGSVPVYKQAGRTNLVHFRRLGD
jgi:pyruvate kinase